MIAVGLLFIPGRDFYGQDSTASYSVGWVASIPSLNDTLSEAGLSWFRRIVLGKKELQIIRPVALSAYGQDDLFILDQGGGQLIRYREGKMKEVPGRDPVPHILPSLVGSCLLPDGRMAFTDSELGTIFLVDQHTNEISRIGDTPALDRPTGIACSQDGKVIWITETGGHCLVALDTEGNLLKRIGSRGSGPGEFNYPTHICTDPQGNILVVDALNHRVQIFDARGKFLSMFGRAGDASGYFARPKGIACDSHGHIYVADALFNVVQVFDREGRFLHAFGSAGSLDGQFHMPAGLCITADNHIFVTDTYNKRIQVFRLED